MPRELRIILWEVVGLTIGALLWINLQSLYPIGGEALQRNVNITVFIAVFTIVFVCGVLIVQWTRRNITQNPLKRYLMLAGASAMGILFFGTVVHMFTEFGFVMSLFVCPAALIVGAALALRFKSTPTS